MTRSRRARLSEADRRELDDWWQEVSAVDPPTEVELEEMSRRNALEARREFDASATLEEELLVRLKGSLEEGQLPLEIGQELFKPLREGVNAATNAEIDLALAGIMPGSTVLRLKATAHLPADSRDSLHSDGALSSSDTAVRRLLDVITEAEEEVDARTWAESLRPTLLKLAEVLYSHALTAEFTWLASSGAVRRSTLSTRGQQFARRLKEFDEQTRTTTIVGTVTELRASGKIKVKPETGPALEISFNPGVLANLRLTLYQRVSLQVEETFGVNMAGQESQSKYSFIRMTPAAS